jgi:anti-sigma-K factor RskA
VAMFDEDQETLAAEYVLGTLSAEEREHAEALRSFDAKFETSVRQWERRLGELNVMVEAIEPPPAVWEKVKAQVGPLEAGAPAEPPREQQSLSPVAAPASGVAPTAEPEKPALAEAPLQKAADMPAAAPAVPRPRKIERTADVVFLARNARRWRRISVGLGALAALLALYVAVWQIAPDLMPPRLRPAAGGIFARSEAPAGVPQDRLVAVLQPGPTAPAFLLTLDPQRRKLFVRRVSATPEAGKSYELWLISNRFPAPRSLGLVGSDEFTQREVPANYDPDTLRTATYAVSLEPSGGAPNGVPTGPVLFTGKPVEALPTPPSPTATPKT